MPNSTTIGYQEGKSGCFHIPDPRDFVAGISLEDYDWSKAKKDTETPKRAFIRNQGQSLSCVGQTSAEMVDDRLDGVFSARYVYSQIFLPQGGAYCRNGVDIICNQLVRLQKDCVDTPDEVTMRVKSTTITKRNDIIAYISLPLTIDLLASAVDRYGSVMIGVYGANEGWHTPDVYITKQPWWGHAIKLDAPVIRNGKKAIRFLNHWGEAWGDKGYGYLSEEYIAKMAMCAFAIDGDFKKPVLYVLKNPGIAKANPNALANRNFINALFKEYGNRDATEAELKWFVGYRVKDAANFILGAWRSPFYS